MKLRIRRRAKKELLDIDDDAAFFALVKAMLARASVLSWGMLSSGDRLQHLEREGPVPDQLKILPVEGKQISPKPASVESQKDVVQHLLDLGLSRRLLPRDAGDERSGVLPVLEVGGGDPPRALERSDVVLDQSDAGWVERSCVELDHDIRQTCPEDQRSKLLLKVDSAAWRSQGEEVDVRVEEDGQRALSVYVHEVPPPFAEQGAQCRVDLPVCHRLGESLRDCLGVVGGPQGSAGPLEKDLVQEDARPFLRRHVSSSGKDITMASPV